MSGQGFEFTPGGIQPLAEPTTAPGQVISAAEAVAQMRAAQQAQVPQVPPSLARAAQDYAKQAVKPVSRRSYIAELKARLKVLEREIRSKAKLEREAAELRRMLAAAKQPPAEVADIHQARRTG